MGTIEIEVVRKVREKVKKCDRCGRHESSEERDPFQMGGVKIRADSWAIGIDGASGGSASNYDLCFFCMNAFQKFIEGYEVSRAD